jgi:hypothetical protein
MWSISGCFIRRVPPFVLCFVFSLYRVHVVNAFWEIVCVDFHVSSLKLVMGFKRTFVVGGCSESIQVRTRRMTSA